MPSANEPGGGARLVQLLAKRRDIKVHPKDALAHDGPRKEHPHHFHKAGEILVSNDPGHVEAFERAARKLHLEYHRAEHHTRPRLLGKASELASPLPGATRFFLDSDSDLEDVLRQLEEASHGEFVVSPNHVLFSSQYWGYEPYGDPAVADRKHLSRAGEGAGVVIAVIDTGLPSGYRANPVLEAVETWPSEEEPWSYDGRTPILVSPQGHGAFVAGVVLQAAGKATVRSYRAVDTDGVTDEWYLGNQMALVLAAGARVINLSLGTPTRADQSLMGLSALEAAARQERQGNGPAAPIVVAAAGNAHDSRKWYPAADPWTISVGAVKTEGKTAKRASFSNFGDWVDVWANGFEVLSAFEAKPFRTSSAGSGSAGSGSGGSGSGGSGSGGSGSGGSGVLYFDGAAIWSGTSFAAAHVSGKVAEILQSEPGLGRDAVLKRLAAGAQTVPHVGVWVR